MRAIWKDTTIAESDDIVVVEGNAYFPRAAVREEFVEPSDEHSRCPWKGTASYLDLRVGDARNAAAAWFYPDPKPKAENIRDRVAFWKGVAVVE